MKKFLLLLTLVSTPLLAHFKYQEDSFFARCASDCINPCWQGSFAFGAEWIYFKPTRDEPYYVGLRANNVQTFAGELIANDFDYKSGFRFFGAYTFCANDLELLVRWTRLHTSEKDTTAETSPISPLVDLYSPQTFNLGAFSGFARMETHFDYDAVEATLNMPLFDCPCWQLYLSGGFHYAQLDWRDQITYFNGEGGGSEGDILNFTSDYWGIGPQIGMDIEWNLTSCFSFGGSAAAALLGYQNDFRFKTFIVNSNRVEYDLQNEESWNTNCYWDLRFALTYTRSVPCLTTYSISAGWEMLRYSKAITRLNVPYDPETHPEIDFMDFSLFGPFISAGFTF